MLKKSLSILLAWIISFGAVVATPFTALSENASEIVEETFADDGAESVIANNTSIPESELQESDNNKSEDSVVTLANEEFINEKADLASTGAEQTYGDFKYTVSGSNATLTGYIGSGGAITIPAKINGYTVSGIGTGAFRGNKVITKLTIEAALTSMGNYAFAECTSLTSVVIKSGTTLVGYNAFGDCTSLASVSLPSTLKTISGYAFNNCGNLSTMSTITIPDSVTEIGTYAFRSSGIKTLKLGSNVKMIGSDAFAYCNNLTSITLPNSVTSIGSGAFSNCSSLDSVNIGNSVTEMGNYAFGWDTALTKVVIADGTKVIGKYAFATSYGNSSASKLNEVRIPASVEKIGDANSANNVKKDNSVFGTGRTVKAKIYGINGSFANQFCNANAEACNLEWCNGGDTTPPTASISSTNNVASSQTVTLSMSDDFELSVYYWGTNSSTTSISWTSISGKSKTVTTTVSSGSTYYLTVKDTSGNITQKSATFYMTTLNANDGSVSPTSITTKSGNSFTFPTPTRSGYTYNGWSTSSSATSGITSLKPTGNQTYYAIWTADLSDTTKPSASISSTNNVASSQTVTLSMSDNVGLACYYWGTSSSSSPSYTSISGKSYSTDKTVSSSGTYYLTVKDTSGNVYQTSATFYKTTLNANGGSVSPTSITTKSGNSFTFPTPTRSGYTYNGWSTSSSTTSGITSLKPTGNQIYYAVWLKSPTDTTKPTASITWSTVLSEERTATLTMSDDTALSGYYWGTSSSTSPNYTSISGKNYTTTKVITNRGTYYLTVKDAAGNYVQTSITIYKTTFNANGGSVNYTSVLSKAGNTLTIPATRSGYTFKGWATKATATSGDFTIKPTGDNTYYAIWEADSTDTTKPSASISSTNNVASSQIVTLSMSDNVGLAGYYWGTSSSTSPSYTAISGKNYSTDITVSSSGTYYLTVKDTSGNVHQISATFYKTTLDANGGSVFPSYVLTKHGNSFDFPTPILKHLDLGGNNPVYSGWSTSSTAISGIYSLTPNANQTYFAVWINPSTDTTKPTASISSTNFVASSQTVWLSMSDDVELTGYYWGTSSSTSPSYTSISGKSYSTDKTVSSSGTYYLTVKDTSGNVYQTSVTFYKTTLNANGGSVSPTSITTKSGNSFTFPTPTRSGYTYNGWSTSSSATSGITSLKPTGNQTYYAVWNAESSFILTSTNDVASSQEVALEINELKNIEGYYWGTDADYSKNQYVKVTYVELGDLYGYTDRWQKVDKPGTYYATLKDNHGISETATITLYKTSLNANGGSVSLSSVLTKSGNSFTMPTPTRTDYTFNGWSTNSAATSGVYSLTPSGNQTYYAVWKAAPSYSITFDPETVSTYVGSDSTVSINFSGEGIDHLQFGDNDSNICTASWGDIDYNEGTTSLTFTGKKEGTTSFSIRLINSAGTTLYSKSLFVNVIPEPTDASINVSNVKGTTGKTVDVPITISNNPGIIGMTLSVEYDTSAMELINVNDSGVLGNNSHKPEYSSPYTLSWANDTATTNFTPNGTIVVLTFMINEGASNGIYPIVASYNYNNYDIYDKDLNKVYFNVNSGSIEVTNYICGDVNSDGTVNNLDRVYLTRYLANWNDYQDIDFNAADVDCNGIVNNLDRVILTRYLANWSDYSTLPYLK